MDMESRFGQMESSIMDNGQKIRCMAMGFTNMLIKLGMMGNLQLIRNKVLVFILGPIAECIKDGGVRANSMDMAPTRIRQGKSSTGYGNTVNVRNGSMTKL